MAAKKDKDKQLPELFERKNEIQKYISYIPSPFIAAALPARNVKGSVFTRKYNNITLKISSGNKVPFGKYGRLLLTILTTHAVITKNTKPGEPVRIQYRSLNELMRELQLPTSRCNDIKAQLEYFAQSTFIYEEKIVKIAHSSLFRGLDDEIDQLEDEVKATNHSTGIIPFIRGLHYIELEDRKGEKQNLAFDIILDEHFAEFSRNHSVPINYITYKSISSAIGKDLYAWLVYRNNSLKEPLYVPREQLINQFMPVEDPLNKDQMRTNWSYIKDQIKKIKADHYPELNVTFDEANLGMILCKSKPQIESSDIRYILVTSDI